MVLRENAIAFVASASVRRVAVVAEAPSVTGNGARPKSSGFESVALGAAPSSAACDRKSLRWDLLSIAGKSN